MCTYLHPLIVGFLVSDLETVALVISVHDSVKEINSFLKSEFTCIEEGGHWHESYALSIVGHEGSTDVGVNGFALLSALRFNELAEGSPYSHYFAQVRDHNGFSIRLSFTVRYTRG